MADEERPPVTGTAPTGPVTPELRPLEPGAVTPAEDTMVEGVLVAQSPRVVPAELAALNEAVPEQPPAAGLDRVGSIPQANVTRQWVRAQLTNWRLYLIRFLCAGLAVVVTVLLIPGLRFERWQWGQFAAIALVFGLLNMTVKPMLQFLSLRFIFSTYGLVVVLINTLLLFLLGMILPDLVNAARPTAVLAGGLLVGVLGLVFETILGANPPVLDRDYKERNGLA
jgi:putative membrane protein